MQSNSSLENLINKIPLIEEKHDLLNLKAEINSILAILFKNLKDISPERKKMEGEKINNLKIISEESLKRAFENIRKDEIDKILDKEEIDITLPSLFYKGGSIHPVSFVTNNLISIMKKYGFNHIQGPEIETEYYNFDALNIHEHHPARAMHDTFYLENHEKNLTALLRTHTSAAQIRGMETATPPFAFVSTGRTYRKDFDKTHTPMFNQMECVYVEKNVNMGNLIWMIKRLLAEFFEKEEVEVRFRPSFFPFTEPSMEVDINMGKGFLEVLGSGLIHPKVLESCGINSNEYSGFAIGMGIERLCMLKYKMEDLRDFFSSTQQWNEIYGKRS